MLQKLTTQLMSLPRNWKRLILLTFDVVVLTLAMWASFCLRYDQWSISLEPDRLVAILAAPLVAIPIFIRMGLYRAVLRYLPDRATWSMLQAMTLATILWVVAAFLSEMLWRGVVPRSVPIIYWAIASSAIVGSRFAAKRLLWPRFGATAWQHPSILIYGAGIAGSQLAVSLRNSHTVVGFLDDNPALHRREVAGFRVYSPSYLPHLVRDFGVKQVILSIPSLSTTRRKEIVSTLNALGVKVQSLPGITDLVTGKYLVSQIREIDIDDLLGRSSVPPDPVLLREIVFGRTIMVTGAGGSIGSELCRKIAQWNPQRLILFEANEYALYRIERELHARKDTETIAILGSITDTALTSRTFAKHGVDAVFHAAAHKHVPLVEANALEGIRNNVFGTKIIADAALAAGVKNFVLISSDKAVRPTNVMGATKRWAELIIRQTDMQARSLDNGQRFCAVRFGNVLGSSGSVVPLFKEQIAHGGPVTLTDPAMTRYFMSIQEAAELIVQAGALSQGGDVFLLDMGEPMLISDLAENMIRLAGLTAKTEDNPDGDIEIVSTGKRPGEKMYEELFYDKATAVETSHPKILRGIGGSAHVDVSADLEELFRALEAENEPLARSLLFSLIVRTDHLDSKAAAQ